MQFHLTHVASFVLGTAISALLWSPPTLAQTANDPCVAPDSALQTDQAAPSEPAPAPLEPNEEPTEPQPDPAMASPIIRLSELFPDPEGSDEEAEFIEIVNAGATDADVSGWAIETASGKTFMLATRVAAFGRYAFSYADTRLPLSNAGTTVTLRDASGSAVDVATYPGPAKTGKAYARDNAGAWRWTSLVTPGSENAFDPEPAPSPTPTPSAAAVEPAAAPEFVDAPASPAPVVPVMPDLSLLRITEFLADPAGSDDGEWVELHNAGDAALPLDGIFLDDAEEGSEPFALSGIRIEAGGYSLVRKSASGIALNNAGDAVRLLRADGGVIASVRYAIAPEGKSHALIDGEWEWTDAPTPDGENIPMATAPDKLAPAATAQAETPEEEPADEASVNEISDADDETLIAVTGTVTLPPGTLGKRTFAIQDDTAAVIVRAHGNAPMPPLSAGDVVRVVGRKRDAFPFSTTGRMIELVGTDQVAYAAREVGELSGDDAGLAVRIRGIVTRRTAKSFVVADEDYSTEATVRADMLPDKEAMRTGATVTVRGVVRARNERVEIVAAALEAVEPPATADSGDASPPVPAERERATFVAAAPNAPVSTPIAAGAAGSSIAVAALIALLRRRRAADGGGLPVDG